MDKARCVLLLSDLWPTHSFIGWFFSFWKRPREREREKDKVRDDLISFQKANEIGFGFRLIMT